MPAPLLLAATSSFWSTIGPVFGWVVAGLTLAERAYGWFFGGTNKRLEALEAAVSKFVPQEDIKAKNKELGEQIADNQGKIKLLHDRAEEITNKHEMRIAALEQHNVSLTLLPSQVQKLNTDHAVLANEVRTLAGNIDKLSEKQDSHYNKLMEAISNLSFTRGQLQGGKR